MSKDLEIRIGINIGKTDCEDRGITVYTKNILSEFGQIGADYHFVLFHYPDSIPDNKFGIDNADLRSLSFSDKNSSWQTMIGEQIFNPIQQKMLNLDVVWHPHNRSQFIVPVGYVCTMHDILPISQPGLAGQYLNKIDKKALYLSRTYSAQRANMVITGSEFSRTEIINHLNVNPDRVVTIYYGLDRSLFKPNRNKEDYDKIRRNYSLPTRYILTTGSYAPHKNLRVLVDAYNQSNLPKKGIGLVMVGPNDATGYRIGYQQLKEHIRNLGVADKVSLLPSVPVNDLITIYSNAEIFATASLYEGFGFTPLEAMACEIPVVASDTTSIPEVCGNAVLYANPHNALEYASHFNVLIQDENIRHRLIKAGRSQVEKYDWQKTARKTLNVLKSVAISRK